jgi:beta-phosphoglucomutase family hydrolase
MGYGRVGAGIEAWLFDLDGVLTDTARVHAAAWADTFDAFLRARSGGGFRPFDADDYERYVDGKPRNDGVRDFLASRGISLAEGSRSDPADLDTVCGLGTRKNEVVLRRLADGEVAVFPGSVTLVTALRRRGVPTAVVSASENCAAVLRSAGITDLFDVVVDGRVAAGRHLAGKPAPDTFLYAADALGVPPARAAVVEDALAGVHAGRAGGFGLVVGVARRASRAALFEAGADVVVGDLEDLVDALAPAPDGAPADAAADQPRAGNGPQDPRDWVERP